LPSLLPNPTELVPDSVKELDLDKVLPLGEGKKLF